MKPRPILFVGVFLGSAFFGCGGGAGPAAPQPAAAPPPATSLPEPAAARKYVVRMHRDSRVGERTRATIDTEKHELVITRMLGQPPNKTDKTTHTRLVGTLEVKDVNEKHDSLRSEITVSELWQTINDGTRTVLVQPGARLAITRAEKKEDAKITVNGQPASKDIREAVDEVLTLTTGGPSDDEIFGAPGPQAVGAEWAPNVALAEQDMNKKGITAKAGGISGKVKLAGAPQVEGQECLDLEAEFSVTGIESISDLPAGSVVKSGSVVAHMKGLFPVDEKLGRKSDETEITTRLKVRVPSPQGDVDVEVKTVEHQRAAYTPL